MDLKVTFKNSMLHGNKYIYAFLSLLILKFFDSMI